MTRFCLHYLFYFATFAVVSPFFQSLLRSRGFDTAEVGFLQGLFALAGALGVGPVGRLADRLGRRRDMLAGMLLLSTAVLVPLAAASSFLLAAVLTTVFGVAYKSLIPLGDALASLELPDPTTQYGRARSFGSIGFIAALWIFRGTGVIDLDSSGSILRCFLATAALSLPVMLLLPDSHRHRKGDARPQHAPARLGGLFWTVMTVVFLSQFGMAAHYSFFTLFLQDAYAMGNPGVLWSIGSMAELPVIFLAGAIIRRLGVWWMLAAGLACMSLRLTIYAATPTLGVIVAAQLLHAGTFGLLHTAVVEFISRTVRRELRATAMTIYMAFGLGAAQFVGSSLGGVVTERWGYAAMYLLHAAFPLLGIAALIARRGRIVEALAAAPRPAATAPPAVAPSATQPPKD